MTSHCIICHSAQAPGIDNCFVNRPPLICPKCCYPTARFSLKTTLRMFDVSRPDHIMSSTLHDVLGHINTSYGPIYAISGLDLKFYFDTFLSYYFDPTDADFSTAATQLSIDEYNHIQLAHDPKIQLALHTRFARVCMEVHGFLPYLAPTLLYAQSLLDHPNVHLYVTDIENLLSITTTKEVCWDPKIGFPAAPGTPPASPSSRPFPVPLFPAPVVAPVAASGPVSAPPPSTPCTALVPYVPIRHTICERPRYTFPHHPDAAFEAEVAKLNFDLKYNRDKHPHPHAALQRLWGYDVILRSLCPSVRSIIDIGSNVMRFRSILDSLNLRDVTVHGVMPLLQDGDPRRAKFRKPNSGYTWCNHLAQTCNCKYEAEVMTFIHSLYYFHPREVFDLIVSRRGLPTYAVVHNLEAGAGKLCHGEGLYYPSMDSGKIVCTFKGNTPYIHDPITWLTACHLTWPDGSLTWKQMASYGDTLVYQFYISAPIDSLRATVGDWSDSLNPHRQPFYNAIATNAPPQIQTAFSTLEIPVSKVDILYDRYVVYSNEKKFVTMPQGLISKLVAIRAFQPVSPTLLTTLKSAALRYLQNVDMPSEVSSTVILYAVAIACIRHVNEEIAVLGQLSLFHETHKIHQSVLRLEPLPGASFLRRLYAAITSPVRGFCNPRFEDSDDGQAWTSLTNERLSASTSKVVSFKQPQGLKGGIHVKPTAPALYPDSKIEYREDHLPKALKTEFKPRLMLVGVAFDQIVPTCFETNRENAIRAIESRLLANTITRHTPNFVKLQWQLETPTILTHFDFRITVPNYHTCFTNWVDRFPAAQRRLLLEASNSLLHRPLEKADCAVEVITKVEKGKNMIDGVLEPSNPRAVCSCTARYNCTTGPYYLLFSNALKNHFSLANFDTNHILWTSGCSSEDVGQAFDNLLDRHGSAAEFLIMDQSAFDAHQNAGTFHFEQALLNHVGLPNNLIEAHRMASIPFGKHQVYNIAFKCAKPTRTSGSGITSSGNVSVSIASLISIFGTPRTDTWGAIANGDDILLVARAGFLATRGDIDDGMSRLGLEVKYNITRDLCDVEFCQTLPYPTTDGTIFAPKIGRLMSRLGYTTSTQPADVYGVARGLEQTVHCVPLLRVFLDKFLALSSTVVAPTKQPWQITASRTHDVSPATWDFVYSRYGIGQAEEKQLQEVLDEVTTLPSIIPVSKLPFVISLAKRDE